MATKNLWVCSRCGHQFDLDDDTQPRAILVGGTGEEPNDAWQFCEDCYSLIEEVLNTRKGRRATNYKRLLADVRKQLNQAAKDLAWARKEAADAKQLVADYKKQGAATKESLRTELDFQITEKERYRKSLEQERAEWAKREKQLERNGVTP